MRQLTEAERDALEDTWQGIKSHSSADRISMRVGFIAGLDHAQAKIEALEAFIAGKITRYELEEVMK